MVAALFSRVAALSLLLICASAAEPAPAPPGMVWIPAGEFAMGSKLPDTNDNERPVHGVRVSGFWMDRSEVTNTQFAAFVSATGYKTTAEKPVDWEELKKQVPPGTPKPDDSVLAPGSLVFIPPSKQLNDLNDYSQWWQWVHGADWRHPAGPQSNITGKDDHPVVQMSWDDAVAYATWAGKRLPTEAEWEYAARGGLSGKRYPWGDQQLSDTDGAVANIWQGRFPDMNTAADGFAATAPVGRYPANAFGLHDMAGNVWEWCSDWYRADAYAIAARAGVASDPQGPERPWDPQEPTALKRVTRGGSFLCHVTYCESYRPGARRGSAYDTGSPHIGFRCVKPGTP
ncbi:MAG: formylglycine-generating enzyme family protein [Planctomycetes bacterium]|nr:formylglycine-generating enzyme family protein [Planctomycetota bacterium]